MGSRSSRGLILASSAPQVSDFDVRPRQEKTTALRGRGRRRQGQRSEITRRSEQLSDDRATFERATSFRAQGLVICYGRKTVRFAQIKRRSTREESGILRAPLIRAYTYCDTLEREHSRVLVSVASSSRIAGRRYEASLRRWGKGVTSVASLLTKMFSDGGEFFRNVRRETVAVK